MPKIPQDTSQIDPEVVFRGYITEAELARQRGVSLRTCQRDRALRQAPPHAIVGRQIYYRVEAVREWMLAQERPPQRRNVRRRR